MRREGNVKLELGQVWPQPRTDTDARSEKKQGADSPLELLEGGLPCRHIDFRFLVSRTVKKVSICCFKAFAVG